MTAVARPGAAAAHAARTWLSPADIKALARRSDLAGIWAVGSTWAVIVGTLLLIGAYPSVPAFLGAVVVLGGRQLALAILMHEAAHRTLFRTNFLNDVVADLVCARPVWNSVARYRQHHHRHHTRTGTPDDPDLGLVTPFPTTRVAIARKFARDLLGATALKRVAGQLLMDLELLEYTVSTTTRPIPRGGRSVAQLLWNLARNSATFLATNAALLAVCFAAGHAWVFWAWVAANLTTYNLFLRIRSIAEHACTELSTDPLRNTRTTRAGWLARMTVAPIRVNYHLEHHLVVSVPWFRLPELHRLLRERGAAPVPPGYLDVLRLASTAAPRPAA
ncbi:MAG: fatty acid desaturase family protein [Deltaproteobacteria bacterium]|nr:fatty acid desaturase family protein [Deltaproteobacteria bacterium]